MASFSQKIKSEYYGGNIYVSIEGIALEQFIDSYQKTSSSTFHSCKRHAEFHSFLSDNSKHYEYTTVTHIKSIIELLWSNYHM